MRAPPFRALSRALVGQHAVWNVPPGQEIALGIENRTQTRLKKVGKNVSHFLKRNNPPENPKERKTLNLRQRSS